MKSSLFNDSGVSIPISDDDSDELGRMRVRVRRKRKKSLHRVNNELTRRVVRFFMKYWMALVLVFAIGLLVFEATRIGRKPSMIVKTEQDKVTSQLKEFKRPIPDKKSDSTLNRLDPVMKIVHGVKERKCLFFFNFPFNFLYISAYYRSEALCTKIINFNKHVSVMSNNTQLW